MTTNKKILEKEISDEIRGINYSGFEGGYAFTSFRTKYYEKLKNSSEKMLVSNLLMNLLKNESNDPGFRSKVAWICADIEIPGAEDEIKKMSEDKKIIETPYINLTKFILNQLVLEKNLVAEIRRITPGKDKHISSEIYTRALAMYRKMRGDASEMYASNDKSLIEKAEEEHAREIVNSMLKKILRSERSDSDLKIKVESIRADLNIR